MHVVFAFFGQNAGAKYVSHHAFGNHLFGQNPGMVVEKATSKKAKGGANQIDVCLCVDFVPW